MFKSIVCFTLAAIVLDNVVAISDDKKDAIQSKFVEVGGECIKDHPISDDDVKSFKDKKFPDGENADCFVGCIFKKIGIMDDKGNVSHTSALENAKKLFEDEDDLKNIEEYITTCAKVNDEEVSEGKEGCERAKLTYNCLVENAEKYKFNLDF